METHQVNLIISVLLSKVRGFKRVCEVPSDDIAVYIK